MEILNEYIGLIAIISGSIIIFLLLINLNSQSIVKKYFSNAQFMIVASVEFNTEQLNNYYTVKIYNQNFNDVRITSFGFMYKNQNIDYYQKYLVKEQIPLDSKLVIYSRDHIIFNIKPEELKSIVLDINNGVYKVKKLQVYVIDSLGITTFYNSKRITKNLQELIYEEQKQIKLDKAIQRKKIKEEIIIQKQIIEKEKRFRRNEKIKGYWLRFKGLFKRKK